MTAWRDYHIAAVRSRSTSNTPTITRVSGLLIGRLQVTTTLQISIIPKRMLTRTEARTIAALRQAI